MQPTSFSPNARLAPFVKEILVLENDVADSKFTLPFYADGFAGIVFSTSTNPFMLQPQGKLLSEFYLYGQTINPIALEGCGEFQIIALKLFPFAVRILLGVDPVVLNDDCYDLIQVENIDTAATVVELKRSTSIDEKIEILSEYFGELLRNTALDHDRRIRLAVGMILKSNGLVKIKELRERLGVAERTFERRFFKEIGVTPKQFAKIIQFHSSMNQISESQYSTLTDVGYDNGYSDQSHFIRSFKKYAGSSPKEYQRSLSARS